MIKEKNLVNVFIRALKKVYTIQLFCFLNHFFFDITYYCSINPSRKLINGLNSKSTGKYNPTSVCTSIKSKPTELRFNVFLGNDSVPLNKSWIGKVRKHIFSFSSNLINSV